MILSVELLLIAVTLLWNLSSGENECTLDNGKLGQCVNVSTCSPAIKLIREGIKPATCRFDGKTPIVCCPPISNSELYCNKIHENVEPIFQFDPQGIVGGVDTDEKEFSHMAALGFKEKNNTIWACGGSLISDTFVVTAAHCIKSREIGDVKYVRLGVTNLNSSDHQDFSVVRAIRHPNYKPPLHYHDIALIELNQTVIINESVRPACLNIEKDFSENYYTATGWGDTEYGGESSNRLQKVTVKWISNTNCSESYEKNARRLPDGIVDDWQLCAGDLNKDTCQGDSGGPLQVFNGEKGVGFKIVGVTSFGRACGSHDSPGVYTRISYYIDWIESIVWPN